jgi:hypothetical protein
VGRYSVVSLVDHLCMYDTMVYYGTSITHNKYYTSDILYITTVLYRLKCNVLYGFISSTHIIVVTVHIYYLLVPCNKSYTTHTS